MKKNTIKNVILIVVIMLVGPTKLYSQDTNNSKGYLSYFGNDSTNINIKSIPCHGADVWYIMAGVVYNEDTLRINGNLYYYRVPQGTTLSQDPRIDYYFPIYDTLFVREDITTGRLYRYYRDFLGTGESEKLICDMTLEVGDEFIVPTCHPEIEESYTVVNVSYDNGLKTIRLFNGWYHTYFREGVFPTVSPLYIESGIHSNDIYESDLLCQHKDGEQVYVSSDGCYGHKPWLVDDYAQETPSVFPNIVNISDAVTINSLNMISDVLLVDMFGRTATTSVCRVTDNIWQIIIPNGVRCGIYLIVIKTEKGVVYEKIIVVG